MQVHENIQSEGASSRFGMRRRSALTFAALICALALFASSACGPAALEAKRMADQCNATYGFNTPKAIDCMNTGYDRIAMADAGDTAEL